MSANSDQKLSKKEKKLFDKLHNEYKHNFIGQGIASLIGILIAFIASYIYFGWSNWYILLIAYMVFVVGAVFHTQIRKHIVDKHQL